MLIEYLRKYNFRRIMENCLQIVKNSMISNIINRCFELLWWNNIIVINLKQLDMLILNCFSKYSKTYKTTIRFKENIAIK